MGKSTLNGPFSIANCSFYQAGYLQRPPRCQKRSRSEGLPELGPKEMALLQEAKGQDAGEGINLAAG